MANRPELKVTLCQYMPNAVALGGGLVGKARLGRKPGGSLLELPPSKRGEKIAGEHDALSLPGAQGRALRGDRPVHPLHPAPRRRIHPAERRRDPPRRAIAAAGGGAMPALPSSAAAGNDDLQRSLECGRSNRY